MRESIHKFFQVGTIQWMSYPDRDVAEGVRAIARDDFFDHSPDCVQYYE